MEDEWECNEDLGRGKWLAQLPPLHHPYPKPRQDSLTSALLHNLYSHLLQLPSIARIRLTRGKHSDLFQLDHKMWQRRANWASPQKPNWWWLLWSSDWGQLCGLSEFICQQILKTVMPKKCQLGEEDGGRGDHDRSPQKEPELWFSSKKGLTLF